MCEELRILHLLLPFARLAADEAAFSVASSAAVAFSCTDCMANFVQFYRTITYIGRRIHVRTSWLLLSSPAFSPFCPVSPLPLISQDKLAMRHSVDRSVCPDARERAQRKCQVCDETACGTGNGLRAREESRLLGLPKNQPRHILG